MRLLAALVLSPPGGDGHLATLAGIATLLRSENLRAAALGALRRHARSLS
jgi:hypothetical protein